MARARRPRAGGEPAPRPEDRGGLGFESPEGLPPATEEAAAEEPYEDGPDPAEVEYEAGGGVGRLAPFVATPGEAGEDEDLLQLRAHIEEQLLRLPSKAQAAREALAFNDELTNLIGVGIGQADEETSEQEAVPPGTPVLHLYVAEARPADHLRAMLVEDFGAQSVGPIDVPVRVVVVGELDALSHRAKIRPAPCGLSVGHPRTSAGTAGCLCRGRTGPRRNRLLILSNNHVLANANNAQANDPVLQPGPYDGGVDPRDRIAVLERFVKLDFSQGAMNYVDAATAWTQEALVRRELVFLSNGQPQYFRISSTVIPAHTGMLVSKSGRTTHLTTGRVIDTSATVRVNYGVGRTAVFRDQLVIEGVGPGPFSASGDSGAVVWTTTRIRNPVGLLFAGSTAYTVANKLGRVLQALDVQLYT